MKYAVVLPFAYQPFFVQCMATVKLENVLLVDNTVDNIGIMKSHNKGIEYMKELDADWLIILSAAIRFGDDGGLDFIEEIRKRPGHLAVEAIGVNGWHLIAFNKRLIQDVGKWDENFTPYGYDDLDYSWRIQCCYQMAEGAMLWEKAPVDVKDMGMAHSLKLAGVNAENNHNLRNYYLDKWGILPEEDHSKAYKRPFNKDENSVAYWPGAWEL